MGTVFGFILKLLSGGLVDQTLGYLERKADSQTERERIRTQATIEQIRAATAETRIMADLNKAKLQFPWFWVLVSLFVVPLAMWWAGVLFDSLFGFGWGIADLPQPYLREMASNMVQWLFYTGTVAGGARLALRR